MRRMTRREKKEFRSLVNQSAILFTMLIGVCFVGYLSYLSHVGNVREEVSREKIKTNVERVSWINR